MKMMKETKTMNFNIPSDEELHENLMQLTKECHFLPDLFSPDLFYFSILHEDENKDAL